MAINDKDLLFTFELDGSDSKLQVIRFEGREAISRLFEFDITLVSDDPDIDLDAALKSTAVLTLRSRDLSASTPYRGMLAQFEQLGGVDNYYFYRATLVPRLWRAGLNRLNEVYLDEQTIPQIIRTLLERNDLKGPDLKMLLKEPSDYRARSFTCQYQESDLAFVSRWMEQEGLYYYFDHDSSHSGEVLAILDYKEAQPTDALRLRYTPPENVQTDRQDSCVTAFTCRKTHLPGKTLVQDFNYRLAKLGDNLKAEAQVRDGAQGEYMLYGQNLRTEGDARRLSRIRAEELGAQGTVFHGEAPAIGVRSGYFIEVDNHFRDSCNARYLVTEVTHRGSQAGVVLAGQNTGYNQSEQGSTYHCEFQAIGSDLQYRAPRLTPRPSIDGVLSALIDSEGDGAVAELNEYGQYKVQLLYDYSDKPVNKGSSWLRMATPYAGKSEGMHFPLLKGTEVLLAFNQGDPDQPIILGAAPNSEAQSIVDSSNATNNGIRTAGGNSLVMVDTKDKQLISFYSPTQKSLIYIGAFPEAPDTSKETQSASNPADVLQSVI